jgi:hypothetical protein
MKIYATGCSITAGDGFPKGKQDPAIYLNLLAQNYSAAMINDAEGGSSNLKIFTKAAKAIIDDRADIYVVQWSAAHRHWVYPAPNQGIYLGSTIEKNDHSDFVRQYQILNHDYPNLMTVMDYTRILYDMAQNRSAMIIFVNGLLSWKSDWNDHYMAGLLEDLPIKEQQDFRQRFQDNLELMPTDCWANIYMSIAEMQTDNAPLDNHPGPNTHQHIADLITITIDKLRAKNERL